MNREALSAHNLSVRSDKLLYTRVVHVWSNFASIQNKTFTRELKMHDSTTSNLKCRMKLFVASSSVFQK